MKIKKCKWCTNDYEITGANQKFCSTMCRDHDTRAKWPNRRTTCVVCDEPLSEDNTHHGQKKFCGQQCITDFNRTKQQAKRKPKTRSSTCRTCSDEFTYTLVRGGIQYYCSDKCKQLQGKAKRRGVTTHFLVDEKLKQNNRCKICSIHEDDLDRDLVFDHDHSCCLHGCGKCFRGYLCSDCNTILGYARDNSSRLVKAAEYLMTWNGKRVAA